MIFDIVEITVKKSKNHNDFCKNACVYQKYVVILCQKSKGTNMEATLERPVRQSVGTISMEHWDNLRTIDELDSALKTVIYKHFHA